MNNRKIDEGEVKIAINKMKKGKAVGNDQSAYEMIEALGEFGVSKITDIANYIYDSEESMRQILESVFILFAEKTGNYGVQGTSHNKFNESCDKSRTQSAAQQNEVEVDK